MSIRYSNVRAIDVAVRFGIHRYFYILALLLKGMNERMVESNWWCIVNLSLPIIGDTLTIACSIDSRSSSSLKLVENVVSLYGLVLTKPVNRCCRGMIGVKAGEGMGVGNSRMGERHLFTFDDGTSNRMVGFVLSKLLLLLHALVWLAADALCAFNGSKTGTSMDTFGK